MSQFRRSLLGCLAHREACQGAIKVKSARVFQYIMGTQFGAFVFNLYLIKSADFVFAKYGTTVCCLSTYTVPIWYD